MKVVLAGRLETTVAKFQANLKVRNVVCRKYIRGV